MLQVSVVEMRTPTMPQFKVQGTSAGRECCLLCRNNDMAIQISNVVFRDSGSKVKFIGMVELDFVVNDGNLISLLAGEVKQG